MKYTQTTIKNEIAISGAGLHTGLKVTMRVRPAPAGAGIVFIHSGTRLPALAAFTNPTARNTSLSDGTTTIHTIEHVASALYGLNVDNAEIELDAPEPPAMDGSPLPLATAILETGLQDLGESAATFDVARPMAAVNPSTGAAAIALPHDGFRISFIISYDHPLIGEQTFDALMAPETYARDIAPARTYGFIEEVQPLLDAGLIKGCSFDNAVVIHRENYSCPLRFPNEPVRHKAADMVGDIALIGRRATGHFIGYKSGHALNAALVIKLRESAAAEK